MDTAQNWYIVKRNNEQCEIIASEQDTEKPDPSIRERWGPFESQEIAIARRVGLIRAGKCQPM